jgi:hypothetical protein
MPYKFLSARNARKVIAERRLKISTFDDMNDPFELSGIRLRADPAVPDEICRKFEEFFHPHILKSYGALCLSHAWQSPVLWSHYADNHRGIVLGITFEQTASFQLIDTSYVDSKKERDISALLTEVWQARLENRPLSVAAMSAAEPIIRAVLSTKFSDWSYEQEVRVLTDLKDQDTDQRYYLSFERGIRITEVVLGARCQITIPEILRDLSEYDGPIKVTRAKPSWYNFEIHEDYDQTVTHNRSALANSAG